MLKKNRDRHIKSDQSSQPQRAFLVWFMIIIFTVSLFKLWHAHTSAAIRPTYAEFYEELTSKKVQKAVLAGDKLSGTYRPDYRDGQNFMLRVPLDDDALLKALRTEVKDYRIRHSGLIFSNFLFALISILLILLIVWSLINNARFPRYGKVAFQKNSPNRWIRRLHKIVSFDDVAGIEHYRDQLNEIITSIKNPHHIQRLGAKKPKALLLVGPPGTGKTLLARALAGEAKVPFFSINAIDFIEFCSGAGTLKIRRIFKQTHRHAPCIIFIDELEGVRAFCRAGNQHQRNDVPTALQAFLFEMDRFKARDGVMVIGATNRPDLLNPALIKPGRFDRQIVLDLPDPIVREEILRKHTHNIVIDDRLNISSIAHMTAGCSGSDLTYLINEAALYAAIHNKSCVDLTDFQTALPKIMAANNVKNGIVDEQVRKRIACHQAGHALIACRIGNVIPIDRICIIPHSMAYVDFAMRMQHIDQANMTKKQVLCEITLLMGGRVAEELIFNEFSNAVHHDVMRASELARRMVCEWGMNEKLGPVYFIQKPCNDYTTASAPISEKTAAQIDTEMQCIIQGCYVEASRIIAENQHALAELTDQLLNKEILDYAEIKEILSRND